MKTIGFRAEKDAVNWAVVSCDGDETPVVEEQGTINEPRTYDGDDKCLLHFHKNIKQIIDRYKPLAAGVKYPETFGKPPRFLASVYSRCRVEGVVVCAIAEMNVKLVSGGYQTLGAEMGTKRAKNYVEPQSDNVRGVKFLKKDQKHKEAVLVAIAAQEGLRGDSHDR